MNAQFKLIPLDQLLPKAHRELIDSQKVRTQRAAIAGFGTDRAIDISQYDTPVKSQFGGTCTTFSTIAAMENRMRNKPDMSERSLWDWYGKYSQQDAITAATINWILPEKYWPQIQVSYIPTGVDHGQFKLATQKYLGADFSALSAALDRGSPCIVALETPTDLYAGKINTEASGTLIADSGHAIAVVGYKVASGQPWFKVKNSWGTANGDKGYQWINFNLFAHQGYCVFWEIDSVTDRLAVAPTPATPTLFKGTWKFQGETHVMFDPIDQSQLAKLVGVNATLKNA